MDPSKNSPSVTFRTTKTTAEGESVCEEREVNGCTPEELVELLSVSSFDVEDNEDSKRNEAEDFLLAVTENISKLEFSLSEIKDSDNSSRFRFSTVPSEGQEGSLPGVENSQLNAGNMSITMSEDSSAGIQQKLNSTDSQIDVRNHGLLVVNKNNLYAIVNINLNLSLNRTDSE